MTGLIVLAVCLAMAALGLVFISAGLRNRGKPPPSLTSPLYIVGYVTLILVTIDGVWLLLSGHGTPLFLLLFATWPFTLYGMYRGERSRRRWLGSDGPHYAVFVPCLVRPR
jgi:hypothetical protein